MATFLDALATLLEDPPARAAYRVDPAGWLRAHDAAELCGEDVIAAAPVLAEWFGPQVADAVDGAPAPAPRPDESELDAAIRVLDHLLAAVAVGG